MTQEQQFFYDHAGFSVAQGETDKQGHWRSARQLAKAENFADKAGYTFTWEQDLDGCIGCECGSDECDCSSGTDHETLVCLMRNRDGKAVQSLGGICSPSREYGRVIEAELALEELADTYAKSR